MATLYIVLPLALLVVTAAVIVFVWSARSGQFDDLETPARRMLVDDKPPPRVPSKKAALPSEKPTAGQD